MSKKIFVNLPVKDLPRAKAFFAGLGFSFNAQFTTDDAASMVVSDDIYVMLLTEPFFRTFTDVEVADGTKATEAIVALSAESRAEVDERLAKALEGGATEFRPAQDHGYMYGRAFRDLDGHIWESFWMDPAAVEGQ